MQIVKRSVDIRVMREKALSEKKAYNECNKVSHVERARKKINLDSESSVSCAKTVVVFTNNLAARKVTKWKV